MAEVVKTIQQQRQEKLAETEETVRLRLTEPWTGRLNDLVLYKFMNISGVRMSEIEYLIKKELRALLPDERGKD